jgi:hypothetical protein
LTINSKFPFTFWYPECKEKGPSTFGFFDCQSLPFTCLNFVNIVSPYPLKLHVMCQAIYREYNLLKLINYLCLREEISVDDGWENRQ